MNVEVVVLNWKRPANVARIVAALNGQEAPCVITIIDTPQSKFLAPPDCGSTTSIRERTAGRTRDTRRSVMGATTRYSWTTTFSPTAISSGAVIQCAQAKPDDLLGICGRRLPDGQYNYRGIARNDTFQPVDMLVRLYWIPTRHIGRIGPFYAGWIAAGHSPILLDDDILMTWGVRPVARSWVIPKGGATCRGLPEPHATARQTPNGLQWRTRVWKECSELAARLP